MVPCGGRTCLLVCLLTAAPGVAQEKKAEPITLKKAIEELDKNIALLQGVELESQISKIRQAEGDSERTAALKLFMDRCHLMQESQISQQRLRVLERLQAKSTPAKKTLEGWLEKVSKPTPELPQPPDPSELVAEYKAIDKYALATPVEMTKSIPKLAHHLTKEAKNDKEKARAIFDVDCRERGL